jgi:flagellar basal body-associated protein FliL
MMEGEGSREDEECQSRNEKQNRGYEKQQKIGGIPMDAGIITAIITAIAAILVAILGNIFTFFNSKSQIKQNEKKNQEELKISLNRFREGWVTDLQTTYELERYKARLTSYPEAFKIIGKLSHGARESLTPEKAKQVAYAL